MRAAWTRQSRLALAEVGCRASHEEARPSRDVGVGDSLQEAVRAALRSLGEPYASEIVAGVEGDARDRPPEI